MIEAKKIFYNWLNEQFNLCEIIFFGQTKEPTTDTWLRVYLLQEFTKPTKNNFSIYEWIFNFSFFNTNVQNIFTLDEYVENLRVLIEKRKISFDFGEIEFFEFEIMNINSQPSDNLKNQKIFQSKVITIKCQVNIKK